MAYITGYTNDIFISYAHLDNEKVFEQKYGWIEKFYDNLEILISRRIGRMGLIKIWRDSRKLDGSVLFNETIEENIIGSAVMLCLTSTAYLGSEYCQKELKIFHDKAKREPLGLKVGDRSRILNILLNNISYKNWPKEFYGTLGFNLHDSNDEDDPGDPLDYDSGEYKKQLRDLRDALMKLINDFHNQNLQSNAADSVTEEKCTIYIGDVADSLRSLRNRLIVDLENNGCIIISNIPPPFDGNEHDKAVLQNLQKANVAVHLLDQYPGREIEGGEIGYPQKQTELSLNGGKSTIVWVPSDIDVNAIEQERYRNFMQALENGNHCFNSCAYIRGRRSTIFHDINNEAQIKCVKRKLSSTERTTSLLIYAHDNDKKYALELSKGLIENNINVFINPEEEDASKNLNILKERIFLVSNIVFLYGEVESEWVIYQVSAAIKLLIENDYNLPKFTILAIPPKKWDIRLRFKEAFSIKAFSINYIDLSDPDIIKSSSTLDFIEIIKAAV